MLRRAMTTRSSEQRDILGSAPYAVWAREFPSIFGRNKTNSGTKVDTDSALTMVAVMSCIGLIADGVSTLPIDLFVKAGAKRQLAKTVPAWLEQPNPYQTSQAFWHRVVASMATDGNAFIYTARDADGDVTGLFTIDPTQVHIEDGPAGEIEFQIMGGKYDRSQILHIPLFTMPGRTRGLSPIDQAREAIGLGLTAEEFGARFFQQGTTMSGVIEHPGMPKPDEAKMLREMFRRTHAGVKNSHAVGVLTGGATFKPITITPEQAQFLETRRFQNHQVALMYHIPVFMIDPTVTSSWGSGIEEQVKGLIDYALMPYIVRIEQTVSTFLLPRTRTMKFNLDARLRPKTKERYDSYAVAINNGWMSIDEVRALEDMEPLPDGLGTDFYRPLNEIALGTAGFDATPDTPAEEQQAAAAAAKEAAPKRSHAELLRAAQRLPEPPTVIVNVPEIRIEPHITMPLTGPVKKTVVRDENGDISHVIEE